MSVSEAPSASVQSERDATTVAAAAATRRPLFLGRFPFFRRAFHTPLSSSFAKGTPRALPSERDLALALESGKREVPRGSREKLQMKATSFFSSHAMSFFQPPLPRPTFFSPSFFSFQKKQQLLSLFSLPTTMPCLSSRPPSASRRPRRPLAASSTSALDHPPLAPSRSTRAPSSPRCRPRGPLLALGRRLPGRRDGDAPPVRGASSARRAAHHDDGRGRGGRHGAGASVGVAAAGRLRRRRRGLAGVVRRSPRGCSSSLRVLLGTVVVLGGGARSRPSARRSSRSLSIPTRRGPPPRAGLAPSLPLPPRRESFARPSSSASSSAAAAADRPTAPWPRRGGPRRAGPPPRGAGCAPVWPVKSAQKEKNREKKKIE